jgi:hypothetical protein
MRATKVLACIIILNECLPFLRTMVPLWHTNAETPLEGGCSV